MKIKQIKDKYVTWANAMRSLGFGPCAYQYWEKIGYIPPQAQIKIEKVTNGRLKSDFWLRDSMKQQAGKTPREVLLRVYILDTLIANSGKELTCDMIGKITQELVDKIIDIDSYHQK